MAESTNKRSACDRCRRQKLRCVRETIDRSCDRCRKAKAICYTQRDSLPKDSSSHLPNNNIIPCGGPASTDHDSSYLVDTFDLLGSEFGDSAVDFSVGGIDSDFLATSQQDQCNYFGGHDRILQGDAWRQTAIGTAQQPQSESNSSGDPSPDNIIQGPDFTFGHGTSGQFVHQSGNEYQRSGQSQSHSGSLKCPSPESTQLSSLQNRRTTTQLRPYDGVKVYTSQILDLNRKLTKRAEEYMSRRQFISATDIGMERPDLGPAASRRFMETLFSDSQIFLTIIRRIQSCFTRLNSRKSSTESLPAVWSSTGTNGLDFQTSLAITSAYAHTIQGFDQAFQDALSKVHDSTPENFSAALAEFMPQISVGNIHFADDPQTHVKYLLNLSTTMLEGIETILGITTSQQITDGLLCNAHSQSLLDALFSQNDLAYEKADGTRAARVKLTIDNIHHTIDSTRR